jgi:hypothetical protein
MPVLEVLGYEVSLAYPVLAITIAVAIFVVTMALKKRRQHTSSPVRLPESIETRHDEPATSDHTAPEPPQDIEALLETSSPVPSGAADLNADPWA